MTALRQRMVEDMQLRGLSKKTQEVYVGAVRQLARHYGKSPDQIAEGELRQYLLYLKNDQQVSPSTLRVALYGLKFLYQHTLQREWTTFDLVRPEHERSLPVVLSVNEVQRILGCLRLLHYRVCLSTIYACGLRLREGTHLRVQDVDRERMMLHIRHAKGNKDRYVPLPDCTLGMLRQLWVTHRHPLWLFPGRPAAGCPPSAVTQPLNASGVQRAFRAALHESGVQKAASVHTLRHSYATHLLEAGINLRLIQAYLGHSSQDDDALHAPDPPD